jgi:hypothetical protein
MNGTAFRVSNPRLQPSFHCDPRYVVIVPITIVRITHLVYSISFRFFFEMGTRLLGISGSVVCGESLQPPPSCRCINQLKVLPSGWLSSILHSQPSSPLRETTTMAISATIVGDPCEEKEPRYGTKGNTYSRFLSNFDWEYDITNAFLCIRLRGTQRL